MNLDWHAAAATISAIGILVSAYTAWRLQRETAMQKRRSDLIPIWKEMLSISRIDSSTPDPEQVRVALNLLGLVTQCHALTIVEPTVLKQMFGSVFVSVCGDIAAISAPLTIGVTTKPGRDFLADEKSIVALCSLWSKT